MELIHGHLREWQESLPVIRLRVPRSSLGKRRWHAEAEDSREFGFDLGERMPDGATFYETNAARYVVEQLPEPVLEIALPHDTVLAGKLGWLIGNLHFQLEMDGGTLRVMDDPALRQLFERERIAFTVAERVFHPFRGGHSHGPAEQETAQATI